MRKIFKNSKFKISLQLAVALIGVFTATISTHAWYQLNQAPIQSSMITTTPNISVVNSNVYGHKINQGIGENGFIDYGSDDVATFAATGVTETNHHQDDEDVNFNVPDNGIGYYLVKKNPGGTFKYKYTTDGSTYTSYSTKFTEYDNTYLSRAYIGSYTVAANDEFRVMHYTFADSKTVNTQLKISTAYGGSPTVDTKTGDVKVADAGTYKVWLDFTNNDLSFEATSITSKGVNIRSLNPKKAAGVPITYYAIGTFSSWGTNSSYQFRSDPDNAGKLGGISLTAGDTFRTAADTSNPSWTNQLGYSNIYSTCGAYSDFGRAVYNNIYLTIKDGSITSTDEYPNVPRYSHSGSFSLYLQAQGWYVNAACAFGLESYDNKIYVGTRVSQDKNYGESGVIVRFDLDSSVLEHGMKIWRLSSWATGQEGKTFTSYDDKWNGVQLESNATGTKGRFNYSDNNIYVKTTGMYIIYATTNYAGLSIEKAYSLTLDTQGGTINSGYDETYYQYGMTTTLSTDVTKSGYRFKGWYTASSGGTQVTSISSSQTGALTYYARWNAEYSVTLMISYFIIDKNGTERHSGFSSDQISSTNEEAGAYTPASYTTTKYKSDTTNGIYYQFNRSGTSTWYTNENCSTTYTNGSTLSGTLTLYAKYVADPRVNGNYHTTFYIDITDANTNGSSAWSSASIMYTNQSEKTIDCVQVAAKLYRVTLPNSYEFKVGNGLTSGNENFSTIVKDYTSNEGDNNLPSANRGKILYIDDVGTNKNHDYFWCAEKSSTSYGTATIKISSDGSTWKDPITKSPSEFNTTMDFGDGSANYFVYEHGLQIPSGWYIDVVVSGSSVLTNTSYGQVSNGKYYDPGDRPYISSSETYLKTDNYSGDARFNFYITGSGELSIAMVPNLGNGYYIMPYNSTYKTNNFIGSIKMTTNGEKKATYDGFYVRTANEKYYIRSYLDAVDVKYVSLSDSSGNVSIQDSNSSANDYGVLTFASTGYYSIVVQNNTIYTSTYSVDTSFKLNKLDTSKVTYAKDIWGQKTSLVLEIPFTCANSYSSEMSLNVQNSLNEFIGVSLYVTKPFSTSKAYAVGDTCIYNGKLYVFTSAHSAGAWNNAHASESDPYHFMRGTNANTRSTMYNSLSKGTEITDKAGVSVSNSDGTCYAYILIDYLPTNTNAANSPASGNSAYSGSTCASDVYSGSNTYLNRSISFYLVAEQE